MNDTGLKFRSSYQSVQLAMLENVALGYERPLFYTGNISYHCLDKGSMTAEEIRVYGITALVKEKESVAA